MVSYGGTSTAFVVARPPLASNCNGGGLIAVSWGLDDGLGCAVFFPCNFAASMVCNTASAASMVFNTAIISVAVCAQDMLTSWYSTISVSSSARGFCVYEIYSFFLGDGTSAPVALPLVAHHSAAHNIDQGLALLVAVN